jgi:phage recombination protein Bet
MTKELTTQTAHNLSDNDVRTLIQAGIIPEGTPKAQIAVFGQICRERGLSAFSKEIHLVGYGGKYSVIVGINGFRKIASESGAHAGTDDVKFDLQPDGKFTTAAQLKAEKKVPQTATCTVYRIVAGQRVPFTHTVVFSEFSTGKNKWADMPFQMIGKVAEAFALRKGFSDRLTGLSIEEEAAAYEGTTIQAAQTRPELTVDVEALKDRLANVWTPEVLMEIYQENAAHKQFAELFTERKNEILEMRANGQIK